MSDEREPLWSADRIRRIMQRFADPADMAIGMRDDYETRIAELEATLADVLATNRRNVEDAARIINGERGGLQLAHISLVELGKRDTRITELEAQLEERWTSEEMSAAHDALLESDKRIVELEAQLTQQWEPLPDGTYHTNNAEIFKIVNGDMVTYAYGSTTRIEFYQGQAVCRLVTKGADDTRRDVGADDDAIAEARADYA